MAENPWEGFEHPDYELVDEGREAIFLIPEAVFIREVREEVERFLKANYRGYRTPKCLVSGVYVTDAGNVEFEDCVEYIVAFKGKDRIPGLAVMLANLARMTDQECIYLKAGQYVALLRPKVRS